MAIFATNVCHISLSLQSVALSSLSPVFPSVKQPCPTKHLWPCSVPRRLEPGTFDRVVSALRIIDLQNAVGCHMQ